MAKKKTFEESVEAVEALIEQIEAGEIGLEDALKHYEQGTKLIAHCRGILDAAEKKIAGMTAGGDGDTGPIGETGVPE